MIRHLLSGCLVALSLTVHAQKFSSESGFVSFFSDAVVEDIKAENRLVGSLFNAGTGELVYIIKIKDFQFNKSLMREHFNEKYMETEKYPKSTFEGKLLGFRMGAPGVQRVHAVGQLSIHGVTRQVDIPGTLEFRDGKAHLKSKFMVKLADYNIQIPKIIWQNIAEEVQVEVDYIYKQI